MVERCVYLPEKPEGKKTPLAGATVRCPRGALVATVSPAAGQSSSSGERRSTAWRKVHLSVTISRSMGLKFRRQRKQRARFVFSFVAVLNSPHRGQRKRR